VYSQYNKLILRQLYIAVIHLSYFLWSISRAGKTGVPQHDLSYDPDAVKYTDTQLMYERVIAKTFAHYTIPLETTLETTPTIHSIFKSKIWCMGKRWAMLGTKQRLQQLSKVSRRNMGIIHR